MKNIATDYRDDANNVNILTLLACLAMNNLSADAVCIFIVAQ